MTRRSTEEMEVMERDIGSMKPYVSLFLTFENNTQEYIQLMIRDVYMEYPALVLNLNS